MKIFTSTYQRVIGVIGVGKLGETLTQMILKNHPRDKILASVITPKETQILSAKYREVHQFTLVNSNRQIADLADILFIAVPPAQVKLVCQEIKPRLADSTAVISTAATVSLAQLQEYLPSSSTIIRCMPNVACLHDYGTVYFAFKSNRPAVDAQRIMHELFFPNNTVMEAEKRLEMATLISGCGPALLAWYLQQLYPHSADHEYMLSALLRDTFHLVKNRSLPEIIDSIRSPEGVTDHLLTSFRANQFDQKLQEIMAQTRTKFFK